MIKRTRVPPPQQHPVTKLWWIPPLIPHWEDWIGYYELKADAVDDAIGMEETINNAEWRMMMLEAEEDFEDMWEERERLFKLRKQSKP